MANIDIAPAATATDNLVSSTCGCAATMVVASGDTATTAATAISSSGYVSLDFPTNDPNSNTAIIDITPAATAMGNLVSTAIVTAAA